MIARLPRFEETPGRALRYARLHREQPVKPVSEIAQESVYWWRLPDDETALMSLRPAALKCYLVVTRAIQRDRNQGKLSIRQIAKRAQLNPKHAHSSITDLVSNGMLVRDTRPGATAVYRLPSRWRNCTPTGEQLWREPEAQGEQHCVPTGEQNCTPTGEQHLESSKFSEPPSSSNQRSGRFENPAAKSEATTTGPSLQRNPPLVLRIWSPTGAEILQAREAMQKHFRSDLLPDLDLTRQVLAHMNGPEDVRLWLLDLRSRLVQPRGWGFYLTDAATWPARRPDVTCQVNAARETAERSRAATAAWEEQEARRIEQQQRDYQSLVDAAIAKGLSRVDADSSCPRCIGFSRDVRTGEVCNCITGRKVQLAIDQENRCAICRNNGLFETPDAAEQWTWCTCKHASKKRELEPDAVKRANVAASKLRRFRPTAEGISETKAQPGRA